MYLVERYLGTALKLHIIIGKHDRHGQKKISTQEGVINLEMFQFTGVIDDVTQTHGCG